MRRWSAVWAVLRGLVVDNLLYKVVAFLIAVTVWAGVQSELVVEDRFRVPIHWVLPDGLVMTEAPLESATVTVGGVQTYVRSVRQKELGLTIDLSSASEGEVNVDLSARPVEGLPDQVRVTGIAPGTLRVTLDRVLKRRVSVKVATRGEVAEGYVVKKLAVEPERVEIAGPADVVRTLTEVATDPVDLSSLRESAEFEVGLALKKGQVTLTRPTPLTVTVDVASVEAERRFAGVPVVVRGAGAWETSVPTVDVTLAGPDEAVAKVSPDALSVLVYVPEGFTGEGEARLGGAGLRFEVVHPAGDAVRVTHVDPEGIRVTPRVAP